MRIWFGCSAFLAVGAAAAALAGCASDDGAGAGAGELGPGTTTSVVVDRVLDGDTIDAQLDDKVVRVRLLGIDTPESVIPDQSPECFGPEASRRTRELLPEGAEIELVTDPRGEDRDRFGRVLAYVDRDGGSVNEALLRSGHAEVFAFNDRRFERRAEFEQAERAARREQRGLWGACG